MGNPLLELDAVGVSYTRRRMLGRNDQVRAVRDLSLTVERGEAFAIVGESGAGKSSVARCIVGVQRPTEGRLLYEGRPLDPRRDQKQRRAIQMIFQDPNSSLHPRMTVGSMLVELIRVHRLAETTKGARQVAADVLREVGLPSTALDLRPGSFSGGQRQRIGIARALVLRPQLLVADEPVSALDVSVQASILALLSRLQRELGLTIVLVSHDLAVVHQFCDRVAVMQNGKLVESGPVGEVFASPRARYTQELLEAATELPPLETPASVAVASGREGGDAT